MQYRQLGRNRLGQKQGLPAADSVRLVRGALDFGIKVFDTAPSYTTVEAPL